MRDWQAAGVSGRLHRVLLDRLGRANAVDWGRCVARQRLVPGQKGGEATGPNPTDRGKAGSKRHVLVDANGIPLAIAPGPANVHDSRRFEPLIDAVPPIRQCAGTAAPAARPSSTPTKATITRAAAKPRGAGASRPGIARRGGVESGERASAATAGSSSSARWRGSRRFRRPTVRYERRLDIVQAFHLLAAALICRRFAERWYC